MKTEAMPDTAVEEPAVSVTEPEDRNKTEYRTYFVTQHAIDRYHERFPERCKGVKPTLLWKHIKAEIDKCVVCSLTEEEANKLSELSQRREGERTMYMSLLDFIKEPHSNEPVFVVAGDTVVTVYHTKYAQNELHKIRAQIGKPTGSNLGELIKAAGIEVPKERAKAPDDTVQIQKRTTVTAKTQGTTPFLPNRKVLKKKVIEVVEEEAMISGADLMKILGIASAQELTVQVNNDRRMPISADTQLTFTYEVTTETSE